MLRSCQFGGHPGGKVDIASGKFIFNCTEAYCVTDGVIGAPLKNAALIGDGPSVITKVGRMCP
jgi:TldD protein